MKYLVAYIALGYGACYLVANITGVLVFSIVAVPLLSVDLYEYLKKKI